ncbi:hypothetical protein [Amycolatopsis sp. NPDC051716]|uniref:hypothetical protein n=1 Tax=Amycolatopsis sp. NPDC051716 TaxID=3155804 RepID=UPI00342C4E57
MPGRRSVQQGGEDSVEEADAAVGDAVRLFVVGGMEVLMPLIERAINGAALPGYAGVPDVRVSVSPAGR